MTDAASASREGQILAGKFKLEKRLGGGGMGEVYRALNMDIGRVVAIKVLRSEYAENPDIVDRFLREARAAIIVKHPHVVDVLDVDRDENGVPFIVQEFLEGEDLGAHIENLGGRISASGAIDLLMPVIEAVALAHSRGVIHRDLKPENVFLARDGNKIVPKLLDFGISQIRTGDVHITATGMAMGTPAYMSPEQIKGAKEVDCRTDVWALGVMLYELLAGDYPFKAETQPALFVAIATTDVPDLHGVAPHVSPTLCRIVHRCMRRNPDERYPSAAELARDLNKFLDGEEIEPTLRRSIPPLRALLKQLDADQASRQAFAKTHPAIQASTEPFGGLDGGEAATRASKVPVVSAPSPKEVPDLDLPPLKPRVARVLPAEPPTPSAAAPTAASTATAGATPASTPTAARSGPRIEVATLPPRRPRPAVSSTEPVAPEPGFDPSLIVGAAVIAVATVGALAAMRVTVHQLFALRELPLFDGSSTTASGVVALVTAGAGCFGIVRSWKTWRSDLPGSKARAIAIAGLSAVAFFLASELVGSSLGG